MNEAQLFWRLMPIIGVYLNHRTQVSTALGLLTRPLAEVNDVLPLALKNAAPAYAEAQPYISQLLTGGPLPDYSVQWVQRKLNQLTGSKLTVDGDIGDETKRVVKDFQASVGASVDGWPGPETLMHIVRELQKRGLSIH